MGNLPLGGLSVRDTTQIRNDLVLEAHPDGLCILPRREGEPAGDHSWG